MTKHYYNDPEYYLELNAPDSVNKAFEKIISYLNDVEEMSNVRSFNHLAKVTRAINSIVRPHQSIIHQWTNQIYNEKREADRQLKIDRIKGFNIGQVIKFKPSTSWDAKHHNDHGYIYDVEHVIAVVKRRNKKSISVKEISRRIRGTSSEDVRNSNSHWKLNLEFDSIIDE